MSKTRIISLLFLALSVSLGAQTNVPGLSTNPGEHAIFPSNGQTPEQQEIDQRDAYNWATQQTGWDPYQAYQQLVQQGYAADQSAQAAQGGAVGGAARGALFGAAIGAIAGDAGEGAAIGAAAGGMSGGMRSRRARQSAEAQKQTAIDQFRRQFAAWDKNFVAAMIGKGYSVQ